MSDIKTALKKAEELKNFAETMEGKNAADLSNNELYLFFDKLQTLATEMLKELSHIKNQTNEK